MMLTILATAIATLAVNAELPQMRVDKKATLTGMVVSPSGTVEFADPQEGDGNATSKSHQQSDTSTPTPAPTCGFSELNCAQDKMEEAGGVPDTKDPDFQPSEKTPVPTPNFEGAVGDIESKGASSKGRLFGLVEGNESILAETRAVAGAVLGAVASEPRRVLTDVEAFVLEMKRALVGPTHSHLMRMTVSASKVSDAGLAGAYSSQAVATQLKGGQKAGGSPSQEYVISVNGILEYRPPTAHGAVRVVSVLLLLASAIVLGIGWRYGSAPGMYPYVEDCRL